jgi:hypothetical protein
MPIIRDDIPSNDKLKPATVEYFWKAIRKIFSIAPGSYADTRIRNLGVDNEDVKNKVINVGYVLDQATKINNLTDVVIDGYNMRYNLQADLRFGNLDEIYLTDKIATIEYVRRVINCINSCSRSCTSCTNGCSSCASQCTNGCNGCSGCSSRCTNACTDACTSCSGCTGCEGGPCNCDCPCQGPCTPCNEGGGSGPCGCPACGTSFFYEY